LPLNLRCDERDFFFLGDDNELVTGATGASAHERDEFNRALARVS
jgi:hypothetical protein